MTEKEFNEGRLTNPKYKRMFRPSCLLDIINYLDFFMDFYSDVIKKVNKLHFHDEFQEEMSSTVKMMFAKANGFRVLLDNFYRNENETSKTIIDHTTIFTIVRAAYELLCTFELVCVIPDTDEKRLILKNAYIASGLSNRRKLFTNKELLKNKSILDGEVDIINRCKSEIHDTMLYKSLKEKEQKALDKEVFENMHFQLYFDSKNKLKAHVGWDEVRNLCNLGTETLKGLYKYACNMAHPSYLSLIQFKNALNSNFLSLAINAANNLIAIMSVFIMDYLNKYNEIKYLYDNMDQETKFMISWANHALRIESNN